jgi:hypothetical protein
MPDDAGDDSWAAIEAKDWKDGRHRRENRDVLPHAAEIGDRTTRETMTAMQQAFRRASERGWVDEWSDEGIRTAEDTALYRDLAEYHGTERFAAAVEDGSTDVLRSMVGSESQRPDVSGYRTIKKLEDEVAAAAFIAYMWAEPGSGKSNFGCFLGELWKDNHPAGEIGTNIRTLQQADRWIPSYPQLEEWLKEDADDFLGEGDGGTRKLFIFDEASSHASGRGEDGYEAASKLGPLLYKIRKYGGSLIIIGHDGKDVHPAVRALGKAIHKEDLKSATFYETVDNRQGKNEQFSVEGIPETSWSYDDKEATRWSWGYSEEKERELETEAMELAEEIAEERVEQELEELAADAIQSGQSLREVAEWHPWSKDTVNRRVDA